MRNQGIYDWLVVYLGLKDNILCINFKLVFYFCNMFEKYFFKYIHTFIFYELLIEEWPSNLYKNQECLIKKILWYTVKHQKLKKYLDTIFYSTQPQATPWVYSPWPETKQAPRSWLLMSTLFCHPHNVSIAS